MSERQSGFLLLVILVAGISFAWAERDQVRTDFDRVFSVEVVR